MRRILLSSFLIFSLLSMELGAQEKRFGTDANKMKITNAFGFEEILTTLSIALVGKSLMSCSGSYAQADVMLYAGGALGFLAGEIVAFNKFEKAKKNAEKEIVWQGKLSGSQKEALLLAKKNLQEMYEAAQSKYKLQGYAATAFTAAAAIAIAKYGLLLSGQFACKANIVATQAAAAASVVGSALAAGCASALVSKTPEFKLISTPLSNVPSLTAKVQVEATTKTAQATTQSACAPASVTCNLSTRLIDLSLVTCVPAQIAFNDKNPFEEFLNKFLAPSYAGGILGFLPAETVVALTATSLGVFKLIDSMIILPLGRSIVFTTTAMLMKKAQGKTKDIMGEIQSRIERIDQILVMEGDSVNHLAPAELYPIDQLFDLKAGQLDNGISCLSMNAPKELIGNGTGKTSLGCSSFSALLNAKPALDQKNGGFSIDSLGKSMANLGTGLASVADALQGAKSISGGVMNNASALGAKLAFAEGAQKEILGKVNEDLKKNGGRAVSLEAPSKNLLEQMKNVAREELKKNPSASKNFFNMETSSSPNSAKEEKKEEKKNTVESSGGNPAVSKASDSGLTSVDFKVEESTASPTENVEAKIDLDKVNEAQEASQILDRPDESIFKVISHRYMKTGLDHLGIEKKKTE